MLPPPATCATCSSIEFVDVEDVLHECYVGASPERYRATLRICSGCGRLETYITFPAPSRAAEHFSYAKKVRVPGGAPYR